MENISQIAILLSQTNGQIQDEFLEQEAHLS